jgi:hypothetical protein
MCEPQIGARRAENASTSAPVLLGTSAPVLQLRGCGHQPAALVQRAAAGMPTSTQAASSKKAACSSGWCDQQKKHAGE